jgi:methylenetetrahydrofolate dehydrogenase (NADP+)/methenyltetrahydrofolate cyclohydrolase
LLITGRGVADTHTGIDDISVSSSAASASSSGSSSEHLPLITRRADVLVVAVGVPQLVRSHWVKPGAVCIDVGINVVLSSETHDGQQHAHVLQPPADDADDVTTSSSAAREPQGGMQPPRPSFSPGTYSVVGDMHTEEVSRVAAAVTPVPGGVGPMTIAAVLHNTLRAAQYQAGLLAW